MNRFNDLIYEPEKKYNRYFLQHSFINLKFYPQKPSEKKIEDCKSYKNPMNF